MIIKFTRILGHFSQCLSCIVHLDSLVHLAGINNQMNSLASILCKILRRRIEEQSQCAMKNLISRFLLQFFISPELLLSLIYVSLLGLLSLAFPLSARYTSTNNPKKECFRPDIGIRPELHLEPCVMLHDTLGVFYHTLAI